MGQKKSYIDILENKIWRGENKTTKKMFSIISHKEMKTKTEQLKF